MKNPATMNIVGNVLAVLRNQWTPLRHSPARGRKALAPLEPLEVRTLLAGEFTDLGSLGLSSVRFSSVAWGDADSDGDQDILITGFLANNTPITEIYTNNGSGGFTDSNAGLTAVYRGSVAWGDYDNDSDLDILLTGIDASENRTSKVYTNDGSGNFSENTSAGLTSVYYGSAAWGDSDNDGDLDILLTGRTGTGTRITKIYTNDGTGSFTENTSVSLTGVYRSSVAWGDADNDGDLDILLTGRDNSFNPHAKVYMNNGSGGFTENTDAGLMRVATSSVAWGDYDNDGDLDILLTGYTYSSPSRIAKVYTNNGSGNFTEDTSAVLTGVEHGSVAWGDYDNDGDLDFLLTGNDPAFTDTGITKLYRNNGSTPNTAPAAPTGLTATQTANPALTFSWAAPTGDATPAAGLSYNLRVGTTPGGSDVFSPMSDTDANTDNGANGQRRLPDSGPIQVTSYTLKNLTPGTTYYWSVQAIDTAFAGSEFAAEQSAYLNIAPVIGDLVANQSVNDDASIAPFSTLTVTDPDSEHMLAKVTILNGTVRGDFTALSATEWTRSVTGNNILYTRSFSDAPNIDSVVQEAVRGLVFQPRRNAIKPNTTELTDISVFISDGIANTTATTRITTTSVNDAPILGELTGKLAVNDNATVNPFQDLTVTDLDTQEMLVSVTILNGKFRGDFTSATSAGWTREEVGNNIVYSRYYALQANIGAIVQAAVRGLEFQPRTNAIKPNTTELTDFTLFINDGLANATGTTRLTTTSINDAPLIDNANPNVAVNDNATANPLGSLTVSDADMQEMLISVTIRNGKFRGDFIDATGSGWTVRYTTGNDITYKRYFSPQVDVGAAAQAAFGALVFQPRTNAIKPGTTELVDFQVTASDGVAPAVLNTGTRLTVTSVNDVPVIGGTMANQPMNDNAYLAPFSTVTVTDPDTQELFVRITITEGTRRGDFPTATAIGWTRKVSGTSIYFERFFPAAMNNAATVQAALRVLVFQPRNNVPVDTTETTSFTIYISDGLANVIDSTTSITTTGVAPRPAPPLISHSDTTTIVLPTFHKPAMLPLARRSSKAAR